MSCFTRTSGQAGSCFLPMDDICELCCIQSHFWSVAHETPLAGNPRIAMRLPIETAKTVKFSVALAMACSSAFGSSHREAPLITGTPKLDAADFYMFTSYETGRSNYVTFVANYIPLQDSY